MKISTVRFFVSFVLDGLNAEAIKPNASVWYVITSRSFVPLPPKNSVSNRISPVNALYTPTMSISIPPPNTEAGMSEFLRKPTHLRSMFAAKRLASSTAIRLKPLHTL